MHRGKEIVVIQKPTRGKVVWYYYYYYTDDGVNFHASNRYSVGLEVDSDDVPKSKRKAERMAKHLKFKKEQERKEKQTREIFSVYTKDWFIWGICPFTSSEEKRGRSLSQGNTEKNRRILEKHILPPFKNLKLSEITPAHIENWMFKMQKKGLIGRSINRYYTPLQTIFREATRLGDLTENPCTKVKSMIEVEKVREILTMQEYNNLFKDNALVEVWSDQLSTFTKLTNTKNKDLLG
ncbi:MAG: phage integrase SAM-like domain-containing protein [Bacteroidetes bacterium]|nr:phage integrase SAM-like domain-containing protein [Bacteroidota bacterium]